MGKWHGVVYNPTESLKTQQSKLQLIIYIMDYKQKDILQKFASQKVDLNLMSRIKSLNKEQEKIEGKWSPLISSAESELKQLSRSMDEWLSNRKEWSKLYDEIERHEKELGVKTGIKRIDVSGTVNQVNKMKQAIEIAIKQITTI